MPARSVGELAASLDLEDVIERTLDAAAAIPGVDAAFLDATTAKGEFVRRRGRDAGRGGGAHGDHARRERQPPRGGAARTAIASTRSARTARAPTRASPCRCGRRACTVGMLAIFARTPRHARRRAARGARAACVPRRPGGRERAPLPRGACARRSRRAHRAAQPALLPRDARARGWPRAPLRPPARAARVRPR